MKYRRDLQVRLQDRYRRLYKANWLVYNSEAGYLVDFIRATPALQFLVDDLEQSLPGLDPADWIATKVTQQTVEFPPTEKGRAKLAWHLLRAWSNEAQSSAWFGMALDESGDLPHAARVATEQVVEPFIEYLQEQLGGASDILYLLERYVRRLEWFEKERLWHEYEADTRHGEAVYDTDLRSFLFQQGVDYPFSQPRSASGEADVVAELTSDDPLVCEIKLFDGDSYGRAYVGKGFRQAIDYCHDYAKTTAYLVVFNVSDKQLNLPTDGRSTEWPPRIESNGVTVFLVQVRARPAPSASARPKPSVVAVTREDLVNDADIEDEPEGKA